MTKIVTPGLLALLLVLGASAPQAQVTGLSGWSLFIDPGHSGTDENVGIYGYAEPQKVLRVGLALREMLQTRTEKEDPDHVSKQVAEPCMKKHVRDGSPRGL